MVWHKQGEHRWREPLEWARDNASADMALLYSARPETQSGHTSFLFMQPMERYTGHRWAELPELTENAYGLPDLVGYVGYGMRRDSERLSAGSPPYIDLPDFMLVRYGQLLRFDHKHQRVDEYRRGTCDTWEHTPHDAPPLPAKQPRIATLASNLTHAAYEQSVAATLERIAAGDFYQANLTRKFFGTFEHIPDYFGLFMNLCAASPAPYSAYIRDGKQAILSSSPELFLRLADDGCLTSRPIKGSAPRGTTETRDKSLRDGLVASDKNQAENLMIVDLMRHDMSRVSMPGSVTVAEQSGLYTYPTIHHLVSTITASKKSGVTPYQAVEACFPPGSMTGAPKMAAMEWCTAQEGMERGVYSGALGWFGAQCCDLSVVIRTLICDAERFEFQVGGGIVADSTPTDEWRETLIKARGIATALGIDEATLQTL